MKIGDLVLHDVAGLGVIITHCSNPYYKKVFFFLYNRLATVDLEYMKKIT
mgnify:CR=1 FL=1